MPNAIKSWAVVVLVITLAVCAVILTRDAHQLLLKADDTVAELARTSRLVADYAEKQKAILESSKNQKALEAGWQTPAVLNGTLREVNRLVIPRVMRTIDSTQAAVDRLADSAESLNGLIAHTDKSLNADLLPTIAEASRTLGVSVESITASLKAITEKGAISVGEINALLADPSWKATLQSVAATTNLVDALAGNLEEASRQMPSIAASVERIAKTSSRYQKLLLLAQLLATITRVF